MTKTVIVRYGELALKSELVRRRFERRLIENIKLSLKGLSYELRRGRGRIFIDTNSMDAIVKRLIKVPGIVSVSPSTMVKASIDAISKTAVKIAKRALSSGMSFAVRTSRTGKHTFSSRDVNVNVGAAILTKIKNVHVNLSAPKKNIFVEIRENDAYVFTEIVRGVGGLPAGTQGNVVILFSGSYNSSIATYLMMKRGCIAFPLFFDLQLQTSRRTRKLAIDTARKLAEFFPKLELRVFSYGKIFQKINERTERKLKYYLCKRAMLRTAEMAAEQVGGTAIVVADDAKQIAEQGLINICTIDEACKLLVLRPLAGMNDVEIRQIARQIGIPKTTMRPSTSCPPPSSAPPKLEDILNAEKELGIDGLIKNALTKLAIIKLR